MYVPSTNLQLSKYVEVLRLTHALAAANFLVAHMLHCGSNCSIIYKFAVIVLAAYYIGQC